ncbi:MAG TPA: biotin--[acetyl-CoA-carboxylase] ligase [Anaerolineales bacterium]|nr:biotin--[acetyl-CoA-carboxylase] ligase [Anaerolineales bacterium]HNB40138.1 biotin--[acetyl-CoA-carboxylase] ligase [Anaerolineales bacterium]HNE04262.1 biotin--[acetyl-CoA-carboxylase] ligase [Anaerolineales bacterium]HNF93307.1 biotin--[acetyl-CoA-carboxylase] ligase [Anaerolineales bacterium]HNM35665.1 biotin--[acetyl-CoA-carboxylase] ligase [Anaerolineales bacterium]
MNESSLKKRLAKLNLGGLRYFESLGSTNDEALAWAARGADDFSLVVADEQTQGRGRLDRKWFTPKGSAIAMSLILRPTAVMRSHLSRTVGLAALSLADACLKLGLSPKIKWPNDILLDSKKTAGILVEMVWAGEDADSLVIGMGINVHKSAVPPRETLQFPATSLEDMLGNAPKREDIIFQILSNVQRWREQIGTERFIQAWEEKLAFRGEAIQIHAGGAESHQGVLDGLESDGSLRICDEHNKSVIVRFGDVSLRPTA